jgi:hypothetical protein
LEYLSVLPANLIPSLDLEYLSVRPGEFDTEPGFGVFVGTPANLIPSLDLEYLSVLRRI